MLNLKYSISLLALCGLLFACGTTPLPKADEELTELFSYLGTAQEADDAELIPKLDQLNALLLETYKDAYNPIPEDEIPVLLAQEEYPLIDLLRGGTELLPHPDEEDSAGALVARPISTSYENHLPLLVNGDWVELFYLQYTEYKRTIAKGEDTAFLNGESDILTVSNHAVNAPEHGVEFTYDTESLFRRIKGVNSSNQEAVIHWEFMIDEAERTEGGYNAYLSYLLNLQIAFPIDENRSFRVGASWSKAGGNLLFFSSGASSGDIGNGLRRVFRTLEEYLESQ